MKQAPDIGVFIAGARDRDARLEEIAASRPTLVVSPSPLTAFVPRRGAITQGCMIDKPSQLARLEALGLPVPKWTVLGPDTRLDPAEWGSHVIIKPAGAHSAHGKGMIIAPTGAVTYRPPEAYPEGHHGRHGPLVVQRFVVTGPAASNYRVNTLFGAALYCIRNERSEALPHLPDIVEPTVSAAIATNSNEAGDRAITFAADPDVLELARRCHDAYPGVPVKGIDIIRDAATGRLFVLELNCGSNTWHISSDFWARFRHGGLSRDRMVRQFGAWEVAARVLIARTRQLAR